MLIGKEKMELLNLRKRVVTQKEEIKRLQEKIKRLTNERKAIENRPDTDCVGQLSIEDLAMETMRVE